MFKVFSDHVIDQIYAYETLKKFAFGLIGIFIPIYVVSETSSIELAFLYLIGYSFVFLAISLPVSYIIARIGFKHSLVLSYAFFLPAFFSLYVFPVEKYLVAAVAVLMGFGKAFHWIALHAEFAVDSTEDSRGKAAGRLLGLPRIANIAAPFIGGIIMASIGFHLLAAVTVFFTALSAVPLFFSGDHRDPMDYNLRKLIDRKHLRFGFLFFLRGTAIVSGLFMFSLYIYYVIGGSFNVGSASSLTSVGMVVLTLLIGRVSDRIERKHLIIIGTIASSLLFFLRIYATTQIEIFLISLFSGLMFMVYYVPFYSFQADMAEDEDVLEFYAFRELTLGIGKVFCLLVALYFVLNNSILAGLRASFIVAGIAVALIPLNYRWIEKMD